jgi:hypothetical protein
LGTRAPRDARSLLHAEAILGEANSLNRVDRSIDCHRGWRGKGSARVSAARARRLAMMRGDVLRMVTNPGTGRRLSRPNPVKSGRWCPPHTYGSSTMIRGRVFAVSNQKERIRAPRFQRRSPSTLNRRAPRRSFESSLFRHRSRARRLDQAHHTKQKRTEHIPLSGPTLTLLADVRAKAAANEANLFPGDASGPRCKTSRSFGRASPNRLALLAIGCTTIDTPTPPILFPAATASV